MRRRDFIAGLAGSAAWPVVAPAQPAPPPDPQQPAYTPGELVNAGHRFFGGIHWAGPIGRPPFRSSRSASTPSNPAEAVSFDASN
jgi:hypothetical protein